MFTELLVDHTLIQDAGQCLLQLQSWVRNVGNTAGIILVPYQGNVHNTTVRFAYLCQVCTYCSMFDSNMQLHKDNGYQSKGGGECHTFP